MSLSTPMPSSVRLARLNDLDRICLVAAASFYHSPLFQYRKPFYDGHSIDTLDSEREKFRGAILDPNRVAIVVEGDLDPDESLRVYRSLKRLYPTLDHEYVPSMAGATRGIVGVAAFRLPSDSKSIGKFMAEGPSTIGLSNARPPKSLNRDQCAEGIEQLAKATEVAKHRYLRSCMRIAIAVHPAYWLQGHGSELLQWGLNLADRDGIAVGAVAATTKKKFFENMGFVEKTEIVVKGYTHHLDDLTLWIGLRKPLLMGSRVNGSKEHTEGAIRDEGEVEGNGVGDNNGVVSSDGASQIGIAR